MIDVTALLDALENAKGAFEPKPWGHEYVVDANDFLLKFIHINDGERTALHYHDDKDELNFIVNTDDANRGTIIGDDGEAIPGDRIVRIHPGVVHRAVGPLDMIEVTSHDPDDITRIADDYGRVQ